MIKLYDRVYSIYEIIVGAASSELILFFVLVAVSIVPAYGLIIRDRVAGRKHDAEKQVKYLEREKEVIAVIKENSSVIAALRVVLENHGDRVVKSIERINDRIDKIADDISQTKAMLSERGYKE